MLGGVGVRRRWLQTHEEGPGLLQEGAESGLEAGFPLFDGADGEAEQAGERGGFSGTGAQVSEEIL